MEKIQILSTPEELREVASRDRVPCLWRGGWSGVGKCVLEWRDPVNFASKLRDKVVKIHVSRHPCMDFKAKNFLYKEMSLRELVLRASGSSSDFSSFFVDPRELYYLRDVGENPRGERVYFDKEFPELAEDFLLPPSLFPAEHIFSSVLRISSPKIRLWTHYDVLDNYYVQIVGKKRATFWSPSSYFDLYMEGDKSTVVDIDTPDPDKFPNFINAQRFVADLEPGDVLFIPSLWFHNMEALDFGIAVNVFWKNLDDAFYDKKDIYGNKDLLPAAKANRMLDNVIKQLSLLPEEYKDFYARQLINRISQKCLK